MVILNVNQNQSKKRNQSTCFKQNLFEPFLQLQSMSKRSKNKRIGLSNKLAFEPKGNVFFKEKIYVDYDRDAQELHRMQRSGLLRSDRSERKSVIPTYNNDKLCFTPSFYIPAYSIDSRLYQAKYNSRIQTIQEIDQSQILVPKPHSKVHCHICASVFQDYNEHIHSERHIENQNSNKYHHKIVKLCKRLEKTDNHKSMPVLPTGLFSESSSQPPLILKKKMKLKVIIDLTLDSN